MSLIILINIIAAAIITLVVFLKRRPSHIKLKHLRLAVLSFILFQLALFIAGVVIYLLISNSLGKEGSITYMSAVIGLSIIVSLTLSLIISNKAIKRKYLEES